MLHRTMRGDASGRSSNLKPGTFSDSEIFNENGPSLRGGGQYAGPNAGAMKRSSSRWKSTDLYDVETISSDETIFDVEEKEEVPRPLWNKEEHEGRLVGGWTRPMTIPCVGYLKPEKVTADTTCRTVGPNPDVQLERATYMEAGSVATPAWPSVLTRVFKLQDARELMASITSGNVAPELWDAHFANEEMLRYEAPLVKESFESFYEKIRHLSANNLTTFLKRFDTYVMIYDALRDLHGYKYLNAEKELIERQSMDIARRYAEISTLMDDPIIDAELGSQFFALEGQAYHYIAKLEEQAELNELAFYMNILSEDIVSDPLTAAMRQIKWAGKLVKTKRKVGEQLEGIYEWLRTFTNFMDDLRKVVDPLLKHWGHFGNDAPGSSAYSTGICSVIEAVQFYMGQVPAPIKSKFLVYLRGAGVKKARHAQDFRFELFKRAMEFDTCLKQIMSFIQEPDLWKFSGDACAGGELEMRVDSLTNYARGFFSMPYGSPEAIEGYGMEQELRARSETMLEKAEAKYS